jgi:serine/threonine-protein kinase
MDFGIARPYGVAGAQATSVTTTGVSLGTPDYMSPEQAQGKQDLDNRSDIYSAGVVFYELFTGILPFTGDTSIAVALKHIRETAVPPRQVRPELPLELELIILRCLEKSPQQRYPDMAGVLTQLAHVGSFTDPTL